DRLAGYEHSLVAVLGHQALGPREGPVMHCDPVSVPGQVAREIAAHDREAGDADLSGLLPFAHVTSVPRVGTLSGCSRAGPMHVRVYVGPMAGYGGAIMMRLLLLRSRGEAR